MNFQLESLLAEYEGSPLQLSELSAFDQSVLSFFVNGDYVDDPFIDASMTHDISDGARNFKTLRNAHEDASFTAFLLWCAAKSLLEIRHLSWRFINNEWYEFKNPPFFYADSNGQSRCSPRCNDS